jgi:hypothetical protein
LIGARQLPHTQGAEHHRCREQGEQRGEASTVAYDSFTRGHTLEFCVEAAFRILLMVVLGLIVLSLAEAMWYLARDSGRVERRRVAKALTARIALSLFLFALLMAGAGIGLLEPG